jgi:Zn-finger nucleic acid-binding protein
VTEVDRTREDDWFRRNEEKLLAAARVARAKREEERAAREKDEERRKLKELHFMHCPKCGHVLKPEDFSGVTVDRCTFCEGVYLDPGELEQIVLKQGEEQRGFLRRLLGV